MVIDESWSNSLSGQNFSTSTIVSSQPWEGMRHLRTYHAKRCGCQGCQNCGSLCPAEYVDGKRVHLHAVADNTMYEIAAMRKNVVGGLFLGNPHARPETYTHRIYQKAKTEAEGLLELAEKELDYRGLPKVTTGWERMGL